LLSDPWLANEQSTESLPDDVVKGLVQLGQDKTVTGRAGDYFVQEVGTEGTHIIERAKMPAAYDVENPVAIDSLTEEEKLAMPKWEIAQTAGMVLYRAKQQRTMVVVNDSAMKKNESQLEHPSVLCEEWEVRGGECRDYAIQQGCVRVRTFNGGCQRS